MERISQASARISSQRQPVGWGKYKRAMGLWLFGAREQNERQLPISSHVVGLVSEASVAHSSSPCNGEGVKHGKL